MADFSAVTSSATALPSGFVAMLTAFIGVAIVLGIILWIYFSLAYMAMAKKAKQDTPGLAWIPFVGPAIVAYLASRMHWWPWLLLIGFLIPFVNVIAILVFGVYSIIWQWKLFEKIGKPGWWALICLGGVIPFLGLLFSLAYLVLIGVAAWSK